MNRSTAAHRATIRRLMAEQTEFGLAIPPVVFRQTDFPNGIKPGPQTCSVGLRPSSTTPSTPRSAIRTPKFS